MNQPPLRKQLVLVRHARAGWETGQSDFDRALLPQGEEDARALGRWLRDQGCTPDGAVASAAPRAETTLRRLTEAWPAAARWPSLAEAALYEASAGSLLDVVRGFDESWQTALLVAHNPGLSRLAAFLLGDPTLPELRPSGLLWLECATESWKTLGPDEAVLFRQWQP